MMRNEYAFCEADYSPDMLFESSMIDRAERIVKETNIKRYIKDGGVYLDVGTGKGHIVEAILNDAESENKSVTFVGVDNRFKFPKILTNRMKEKLKKPASFLVADAKKMPFKKRQFDGVSFFFSFHHMKKEDDIEKALDEALRVLKEDGKIFVAEDIVESENDRVVLDKIDRTLEFCLTGDGDDVEYHYKTPDQWKNIFKRHNLVIEKTYDFSTKYGKRREEVKHRFFVLKRERNE